MDISWNSNLAPMRGTFVSTHRFVYGATWLQYWIMLQEIFFSDTHILFFRLYLEKGGSIKSYRTPIIIKLIFFGIRKISRTFVSALQYGQNFSAMIREFWVKNYLSIRDKQGLSFIAKEASSPLVAEVAEGVYLYKLGILYGSNASGKSNILIALHKLFNLLILSQPDLYLK